MIYGGIDVAKYRHEVCLVNDTGDVVLQMYIDNNQSGMDKLLQTLERLSIEPNDIKFCLEATGHYWLPIYCHLSELGFQLHVINPIQSDALRNLYVRKTKTDRKDALLLADLLRLGRAPETSFPLKQFLSCRIFPDSVLSWFARSPGLRTGCSVPLTASSLNTPAVSLMSLFEHPESCLNPTPNRKIW